MGIPPSNSIYWINTLPECQCCYAFCKILCFLNLFFQQECRALLTFGIDSKKCRVMMSSTKGSFSVQEVRKSMTYCCPAKSEKMHFFSFWSNIVCLLFKLGFLSPATAAAVYSNQSESIQEDLPVLQRLCPATIFEKPLRKRLHSLISNCIFMSTIPGVVIKYEHLLWLLLLQFSSCAVDKVRWWTYNPCMNYRKEGD